MNDFIKKQELKSLIQEIVKCVTTEIAQMGEVDPTEKKIEDTANKLWKDPTRNANWKVVKTGKVKAGNMYSTVYRLEKAPSDGQLKSIINRGDKWYYADKDKWVELPGFGMKEQSMAAAAGPVTGPMTFKKKPVEENEFDGKKFPKHNAKVSSSEMKEAEGIARQIFGNEMKDIQFHSKSLDGRTSFFRINIGSTYYRWLSKNSSGQWQYTDDGGVRSNWKPFSPETSLTEMTTTGTGTTGYNVPGAFSRKGGSKAGVQGSRKLGYELTPIGKDEMNLKADELYEGKK